MIKEKKKRKVGGENNIWEELKSIVSLGKRVTVFKTGLTEMTFQNLDHCFF